MYLLYSRLSFLFFFFFNDTATTEIYTLSLHDALPICQHVGLPGRERDVRLALELELPLQSPQRRHELPRARQIHHHRALTGRRLQPAGRDRYMPAVQELAQPVPQRALHPSQLERQLELRIVIAVIDGADFDPQPPAEGAPVGGSEPPHAPRHRL